jgi:hypothetical protein
MQLPDMALTHNPATRMHPHSTYAHEAQQPLPRACCNDVEARQPLPSACSVKADSQDRSTKRVVKPLQALRRHA